MRFEGRGSPSTRRAGAPSASTSRRRARRSPTSPPTVRCSRSRARRRARSPTSCGSSNRSPVAGWIGLHADGATARGNGHARARSSRCRSRRPDSKVAGEFTFADAQLRIAGAAAAHEGQRQARVHRARRPRARTRDRGARRPGEDRDRDRRWPARVSGGGTVTFAALRREYRGAYARSRVRDPSTGRSPSTCGRGRRPGCSRAR